MGFDLLPVKFVKAPIETEAEKIVSLIQSYSVVPTPDPQAVGLLSTIDETKDVIVITRYVTGMGFRDPTRI